MNDLTLQTKKIKNIHKSVTRLLICHNKSLSSYNRYVYRRSIKKCVYLFFDELYLVSPLFSLTLFKYYFGKKNNVNELLNSLNNIILGYQKKN